MDTTSIEWVSSASRWLGAGGVLLAYGGLCALVRQGWLKRQAASTTVGATHPAQGAQGTGHAHAAFDAPWVLYASQSGQAQAWAQHTALSLQAAHPGARAVPLDALTLDDLQQLRTVFVMVSTTGEGDAPDNALDFERRFMAPGAPVPALPQLRYGLMALGDRDYGAYCAFGRRLDAWLRQAGAQPCFDRIEVNQADPAGLADWRREVARVAALAERPDPTDAPFTPWRLTAAECLNPGSAGQPLVQLTLRPAEGALPPWQAGDVVQVLPRGNAGGRPGKPREYSIANLPDDGNLRLLVRRHVGADGRAGRVSGWLTAAGTDAPGARPNMAPDAANSAALAPDPLQCGDTVQLRVRAHPGFRLNVAADVPLILIGNGAGLAGLRAHLQQRAAALSALAQPAPPRSAWLLFGERTQAHDLLLADELNAWLASGTLTRLDRVFSRDTPGAPHVQDRLRSEAERLRRWVAAGAHILVCGSLSGMGQGVNAALCEILGEPAVHALTRSGRIRRDVY